ncbi:MAG: RNA polymerase factor sigma-54, partial [Burkholderiaceae bacterium]
ELHQELEQMLSDNPLLERMDDPLDHSVRLLSDGAISAAPSTPSSSTESEGDTRADTPDDLGGAGTGEDAAPAGDADWSFDDVARTSKAPEDDNARPQLEAHETTLREHLLEQLSVTVDNRRDRALVELLIDALDDNGYLEESLGEILSRLPEELEIEMDELLVALKLLQSFDPAGVGARDASECLAIQIRRMEKVPFVTRRMALTLVENHLELFAQREFNKLKKILDCDDEDLREAQAVIKRCNPHPGAAYAGDVSDYVVPDVIVKRAKHGWQVSLNRDVMPKLRVNAMYANILKQSKGEGSLSSQLQEAKWLIKNMRQRFDTILRVAEAIVDRQRNFFSHGEVAMRPLVLREIADTLGLHESTISRVTTQKYMLTPHGMFELKYFFGSHVATEAGGEASSTAIRALIKQLIGAEDPKHPFSDSKITDMLAEQGMVVARRTVAKYREALKIPPVNLRKSL